MLIMNTLTKTTCDDKVYSSEKLPAKKILELTEKLAKNIKESYGNEYEQSLDVLNRDLMEINLLHLKQIRDYIKCEIEFGISDQINIGMGCLIFLASSTFSLLTTFTFFLIQGNLPLLTILLEIFLLLAAVYFLFIVLKSYIATSKNRHYQLTHLENIIIETIKLKRQGLDSDELITF